MIFRYCLWPEDPKEETTPAEPITNGKNHVNGNGVPPVNTIRPPSVRSSNFTESILGCCPCVFRCRQAIGIDTPDTDQCTILQNGRRACDGDATPIALRINGGLYVKFLYRNFKLVHSKACFRGHHSISFSHIFEPNNCGFSGLLEQKYF